MESEEVSLFRPRRKLGRSIILQIYSSAVKLAARYTAASNRWLPLFGKYPFSWDAFVSVACLEVPGKQSNYQKAHRFKWFTQAKCKLHTSSNKLTLGGSEESANITESLSVVAVLRDVELWDSLEENIEMNKQVFTITRYSTICASPVQYLTMSLRLQRHWMVTLQTLPTLWTPEKQNMITWLSTFQNKNVGRPMVGHQQEFLGWTCSVHFTRDAHRIQLGGRLFGKF